MREMPVYDRLPRRGEADRSANTTPGNNKCGLQLVEKRWVRDQSVLADRRRAAPGERASQKGLIFCSYAAAIRLRYLQLASADTARLHHRRGTPYGLCRRAGHQGLNRSELKQRWHDLIDVDAGSIATAMRRSKTLLGIFRLMLDVASAARPGRALEADQRTRAVQSGP